MSGLEVGSASPSPLPRSPVRTPTTRPCWTSSFVAAVSGMDGPPDASACSTGTGRARRRHDQVSVVAHRRRRRDAVRRAARQDVDRLARYLAVRRDVGHREPAAESSRARGLTTAPESRCEPGCLPFSRTAIGTSPSRSRTSGCSSSSCPSRIAHARPPGPAAHDATPTSIRSSGGSRRGAHRVRCRRTGAGSRSAGHRAPATARAHELGQLRDDLVQVADDPEVAEVEDRRVRVLVDRDDRPRSLHPDLVLDRARDPAGDVELRRDRLAGLPDLRVRVPAGVDDRARCRDGAAERRCKLLEQRERLRRAEPAPARDDDVRVLDRRAARLLLRLLDERRERGEVGERRLEGLDLDRAPGLDRIERARSDDARAERPVQPTSTRTVSPSAGRFPTSSPSRTDRSVRSQFSPASRRAASRRRRRSPAPMRRREQRRRPSLDERRQRVHARLRERAASSAASRTYDLTHRTPRPGRDPRAHPEHDGPPRPATRLREDAERALLERTVVVLEEDEDLKAVSAPTTRSRIFCAAEPSSSIFTWSPRDGGGRELEDGRPRARLAGRSSRRRRAPRSTASPAASSSRP